MLNLLARRLGFLPARHSESLGPYVDTDQEHLTRRLRKIYLYHTEIDFEHIPELFAYTRKDHESLKHLWQHKKVAGIVRAREDFPELNISHKARDVFDVYKEMFAHNGTSSTYNLSIDDDSEYFRVTIEDIHFHSFYQHWPMFMVWNRFVPGKPNRMKMRVVIDNWERSEAKWRGGRIELKEEYVMVNVLSEEYPKVLRADFTDMVPGQCYTIKQLKRDLPDGIELAPDYEKRLSEPLYRIQKTVKSHIYSQYLRKNFDPTKLVNIDAAAMGIELKQEKTDVEGSVVQGVFLSKNEEERMQKLAQMIGKDYEEIKKEIISARMKKAQEEAKKVKPVVPTKK